MAELSVCVAEPSTFVGKLSAFVLCLAVFVADLSAFVLLFAVCVPGLSTFVVGLSTIVLCFEDFVEEVSVCVLELSAGLNSKVFLIAQENSNKKIPELLSPVFLHGFMIFFAGRTKEG